MIGKWLRGVVGKPHDRLCRAKEVADPVVASEEAIGFAGLRRLGVASSIKVHACLWNWHITQVEASGSIWQRVLRRRHESQGLSCRTREFEIGMVITPRLPVLLPGRPS